MTKQSRTRNIGVLMFVLSLVIPITGLLIHKFLFSYEIIKVISILLFIVPVVSVFIWVLHIFTKYKSMKNYYHYYKLRQSIERNLLSIKAYEEKEGCSYKILPKVRITDNTIYIDLSNIKIRKAIEQYTDMWSSGLWKDFVVEDSFISENANQFIIKFEDLSTYKPEKYTVEQFKERIRVLCNDDEIYFDKKHILKVNHVLVAGITGSGKTNFCRNIVLNCLLKRYETIVLDIKESYGVFEPYITQISEPKAILSKLLEIENEMIERQKALKEAYKINPDTVAKDIGYVPIYVIIEEMKALGNLLDKDDKKEFDRVTNNLAVLARASSIHLISVMQNPSTKDIDTTTRGQFETRILLGNNQSNIEATVFGENPEIPYKGIKLGIGQGGIITGSKIELLRVPYIKELNQEMVKAVLES